MTKLADAVAYVSADTSQLKSDMSGAESQIENTGGRFGSVLQGIGMSIGMGVAGIAADALGKVQAFMGDSITAASDLNETVSKTSVVFGENSAAVMAWAESSATALGQSKQGALDAASTFGNLFVSMGMNSGASADMAMGLTQLASDLASFNNLDPTVALEKLRAGMLGQSEPLQSLGVNMTAAAVTAKALEMGLAASTDALTPAMLAQARYAIILDQTKTAQGDFARTSDGLANQQRIADAQWKDLTATVGQALLPVQLALISSLNELTQRVLPPLAEFITTKVTPAMEAIGAIISSTVGPMIEAAMGWFTSLGDNLRGQTDGPFAYMSQWWQTNMPLIQNIVNNVLSAIQGFWNTYGAQITAAVQLLVNVLVGFWDGQFRTIGGIVQAVLQLLNGDFTGAGETLRGIVQMWWDKISGAVSWVITQLRQAFSNIDWGGIGHAIIEGIANGIRNGAGAILDAARHAAESALEAAKNALGIHSPSAVAEREVGEPFAQGIGKGIMGSMSALAGNVNAGLNDLMSGIQTPAATGVSGGVTITINNYGGDPATVGAASRNGVLSALRSAGYR